MKQADVSRHPHHIIIHTSDSPVKFSIVLLASFCFTLLLKVIIQYVKENNMIHQGKKIQKVKGKNTTGVFLASAVSLERVIITVLTYSGTGGVQRGRVYSPSIPRDENVGRGSVRGSASMKEQCDRGLSKPTLATLDLEAWKLVSVNKISK